jgi:hypothetical protein
MFPEDYGTAGADFVQSYQTGSFGFQAFAEAEEDFGMGDLHLESISEDQIEADKLQSGIDT